MSRQATLWAALLSLGFSSGCSDSLDPASLLQETRAVGLSVSVQGDPTRSDIAPGETADITIFTAHAAEELNLSYFAIFCVPEATTLGIPQCLLDENGLPELARFPILDEGVGDPQFTLTMPDDLPDDVTELLGFGAFCAGELADLEASLGELTSGGDVGGPCAEPNYPDGSRRDGELLVFTVKVADGVEDNNSPSIMSFTFAGQAWDEVPAGDAPEIGCADEGFIEVVDRSVPFEILMRPGAGSRETFTNAEGEETQEELQVTHLATDGEMQRTFSFIDDNRDNVVVEWLGPSASVDPTGQLVRFEFVVRDLRGGTTRARRAICIR